MIFGLLKSLMGHTLIVIVFILLLSKFKLFKNIIIQNKEKLWINKIILVLFFGALGILANYTGENINGAIANSRVIGSFISGILGGPIVGLLTGIIAGGHRYIIDIGGFTSLACMSATILEGFVAGHLSKFFYRSKEKWLFSFAFTALLEIIHLLLVILISRPFIEAIKLVRIIFIPMIFANSIGVCIIIAILENIFKEQDRIAATQAQIALRIADKTLPHFRKGFNVNTTKKNASIIHSMTGIEAVCFTDCLKILSFSGSVKVDFKPGDVIKTEFIKNVIQSGKYNISQNLKEINAKFPNTSLKSAIAVPLKEKNNVIGSLILLKCEQNSITKVDIELALGLAKLFSTQIELSKIEYQSKMVIKSQLEALQAQINPHFLFNALNTIISFVRTSPETARELLVNLCSFFRKNLQPIHDEVELSKELEHIRSYLQIEKARFGEKLKVFYDVPKNCSCSLPPLILQPIVENSVKHGISRQVEGGSIWIKVHSGIKVTRFIIKDNGVGIKKENLKNLFQNNKEKESIGLLNINNRLIQKYGYKHRLRIKSKFGEGTIVNLSIPSQTRGKNV